eukprot:gene21464-28437_t
MVARLPPLLEEAAASGQPYQWVLILGGINDVGCGRTGADVFGGLQQLYQLCKDHGASVHVQSSQGKQ